MFKSWQKATTRNALALAIATSALLVAGALPASAHHAFAAEYDADKPVELEGIVQKVRYVNPHSWLYLDVAGAGGKTTTWQLEFGTPNSLTNAGLAKEDLKPGQKVKIKGFASKTPGPYGYSSALTLPDGRVIKTGGAGDAPAGAAATTRPAGNR